MNLQYLEQHFPLGVSALNQLKRYQSQVSWVVFACLIAQTTWSAGQLVWMPFQTTTVTRWHPSPVSHLSGAKSIDLAAIKSKNLFGVAAVNDQPNVAVNQNAPQTHLNLTLVGIVVSGDRRDSLAIIAHKEVQSTYGVGEKIDGTRAKLKAVMSDRVIIDNGGKDETLMLDDVDYTKLAQSATAATPSHEPAPGSVYGKRPPAVENPQQILGIIKRELTKHPQTILEYIHFSKVEKAGKLMGYRLSPAQVPKFFESLGLKNGDIATALNDVDLTDPDALVSIMQQISNANDITLTIERDGEQQNIQIHF